MSSSVMIPEGLQRLLVKLEFLAMIDENMKPNMRDMTFSSADSWLDALRRSLYGEGRHGTMVHLQQIIKEALDSISQYRNSPELQRILINYLERVKGGLRNLMRTYHGAPEILANITVLIISIDLQLDNFAANLQKSSDASDSDTSIPSLELSPREKSGILGSAQNFEPRLDESKLSPRGKFD
jgi:hypothetical protein